MPFKSKLAGCGAYLPERVVTNEELSETLDTSDKWIRQRTGISERRIAAKNEGSIFFLPLPLDIAV